MPFCRYFTGTPVYPFGYGIGLTTFKLSNTTNTPSAVAMQCTGAVMSQSYEVTVTNTGDRTGDEVVLAFFKPKAETLAAQIGNNQLIRQLFGFERVHLAPGESSTVRFNVTPSALQLVDRATGDRVCTPGTFGIEFTNGVDQSLQASVRIEGTERVLEKFPIY